MTVVTMTYLVCVFNVLYVLKMSFCFNPKSSYAVSS